MVLLLTGSRKSTRDFGHSYRPPHFSNASAPLIVSETTTTTTTEVVTTTTQTTQTTTHFFSLPLWKKRKDPSSHSADELPQQRRVFEPMFEKALPPTPPSEPDSLELTRDLAGETAEEDLLSSLSPADAQHSSLFTPSQSSTATLAQAALGLGLPHVIPLASVASSSEVNTIAFQSTPIPREERTDSQRQRKVSMKMSNVSSTERRAARDTLNDTSHSHNRRTRGLSLGTTSFLIPGIAGADGKGREKETEVEPPRSALKSITRKASFWSRKKAVSGAGNLLPASPRPQATDLLLPLPPVYHVSPIFGEYPLDSVHSEASRSRSSQHRRGLSRSHSERHQHHHSSSPHDSQGNCPMPASRSRQLPRRPATAHPISPGRESSHILESSYLLTLSPLATPPPHATDRSPTNPELHSRPRSNTNPPLLRRLSLNFLSSSTSTPSSHLHHTPLPDSSPAYSSTNSSRPSLHKPHHETPQPETETESPEVYLSRLIAAVSKAEIAGILASSADPFYGQALRAYISQFDFRNNPLDVALRRLLMDVGLPRETQQIDRVMEAFAARYLKCNPNLFASDDHPYILAFSLIMLHTDTFNKSNKRKMSKADYIKNTRLPSVAMEVLDYFYDNIVFAPFIFVEDPVDVNGQRGLSTDTQRVSSIPSANGSPNSRTSPLLSKGNKVDPYYLISNNLLGPLRIDVEQYIPLKDPYSYEGTAGPWDEDELQKAFAKAHVIEVGGVDHSRPSSTFFSLSGGVIPPGPLMGSMGAFVEVPSSNGEIWCLKITKVGILNRKDDLLEGGKKASSRKWRPWSVILTGSQLLMFRDPAWAESFLWPSGAPDESPQVILPQIPLFKPDEILSVKDAIAVYDRSYTKHEHTFRFSMADGRHLLLQASDEKTLNEWISRINYASAFKSTGVRMRPSGMSGNDVRLTGVAAATSHLHDLQHPNPWKVHHWDSDTHRDLMGMLCPPSDSPVVRVRSPQKRRVTVMNGDNAVDLDVPVAPEIDGADQLKATFDQVKEDLAAGRWALSDDDSVRGSPSAISSSEPETPSPGPPPAEVWRLPSRSNIIESKIRDLESRMAVNQTQLETDMRFVRNVAVLTPFQRSTRDRLIAAVQGVARRVMQTRLDLARMQCHCDVLSGDLMAEGHEWYRAKKLALKAATQTLQSQNRRRPRSSAIPHITTSNFDSIKDDSVGLSPRPQTAPVQSSHRPESNAESFHSALDFNFDWPPTPDGPASSTFLSVFDSPKPSNKTSNGVSDCRGPQEAAELSSRQSEVTSPRTSDETRTHEKYYTARETPDDMEEAEEWNKTRAAQRVSLVRVPSVLSARFEADRRTMDL